ncbi:MAG: hypothetical protein JXQ71_15510 [Verrucomicrobia bacterium]|nr:hypothetical protein [Verrucomicrobiota bacterium]
MKPNWSKPFARPIRIEPKPVEADLSQFEFTMDLLRCLPGTVAREFEALPVGLHGGILWVALPKGSSDATMARLQTALRRTLRFFLVDPESLRVLLNRYYGPPNDPRRGLLPGRMAMRRRGRLPGD